MAALARRRPSHLDWAYASSLIGVATLNTMGQSGKDETLWIRRATNPLRAGYDFELALELHDRPTNDPVWSAMQRFEAWVVVGGFSVMAWVGIFLVGAKLLHLIGGGR